MHQCTLPPIVHKDSHFSTSCSTLVMYCLFDSSHSIRCEVISLWFWFGFPWWIVMLSIFSCACWPSLEMGLFAVLMWCCMICWYIFGCCFSVAKLCPTPCNLMNCSMPGFPVLNYLPELGQTHVYWVSDTIQPSHPLSPPSPPAPNFSQHQGLFQWVGSSYQVTKVLQLQSFQWIFRTDFLYNWLVVSPCCPRDSQESSPALQFKSISSSALNLLYGPTLTSIHDYWKNHSFDYVDLCRQNDVSAF